jgi:hypothetical protein
MSNVFWKRQKHTPTNEAWNDLQDPTVKNWVLTYREAGDRWLVMYRGNYQNNPSKADRFIDKATMPEEQLRNDLMLEYLLTRGDTNAPSRG